MFQVLDDLVLGEFQQMMTKYVFYVSIFYNFISSDLPQERQGGQILSVFGEKLQQDCQHHCELLQVCCHSVCRQQRQSRGRKTDFGEIILMKYHKMSYLILFQMIFR